LRTADLYRARLTRRARLSVGVLLFDQSVHNCRFGRERGEIRDDRHWRDHGQHDAGHYAADGQDGSKDVTSLRPGRNVYILDIHYDIVANHGK